MAALLPRKQWYRCAVVISRLHGRLAGVFGRKDVAMQEAMMRDHWLDELTRRGGYPIPYRIFGAECLTRTAEDVNGIVYCGIHVPMILVGVRALVDIGVPPTSVIADPGNIRSGYLYPYGLDRGLPAMPAGAQAMVKARTTLRTGGIVGSLLDAYTGGDLRPDLIQLAGRMGARAVLFWTELDTDDVIRLTCASAPYPVADTEEKVLANLAALQAQRDRVMGALQAAD